MTTGSTPRTRRAADCSHSGRIWSSAEPETYTLSTFGTDFIEADHDMSGWRGVDTFLHRFELRLSRIGIVHELQKIIRDALGRLEELIEIASRDGDLLRLADFDERLPRTWNERVDIDDPPDGPCRCNQR